MGLMLTRAKMTTATTGTGTVTLGSAVSSYQSFSAANAVDGMYYDYLIEDGTAWESDVGKYSSGAGTLTRPGTGSPTFVSSTGALLNLSGSATVTGAPNKYTLSAGGVLMPEKAATFTANINGGAGSISLTDKAYGLVLNAGAFTSSGDAWRGYYMAAPGTPWQVYAKLKAPLIPSTYHSLALFVTDGTKILAITITDQGNLSTYATQIGVNRYTNATTYSAADYASQAIGWKPEWLSIKDDGTNIHYYISNNGQEWEQLFSASRTAFLTPSNVGFGIDTSASSPTYSGNTYATCEYWSFAAPPSSI